MEDVLEEYYWASHPTLTWVPAKKVSKTETEIVVQTEDGNQVKIPAKDAINVHASCLQGVEDLLMLGDFNEQTSLHNVRVRYQRDEIYTAVGTPILVSLNPYKKLDIYNAQIMLQYKQSNSPNGATRPHLFQIGEMAYQQLFESGRTENVNQAIIISGESGSGKTEATKIILKYLTLDKSDAKFLVNKQQQPLPQQQLATKQATNTTTNTSANAKQVSIEEQILVSNPLLEAFGNAKTVRNDNSSRFGKFIRIFYNQHQKIHSAQIVNYLLEKCRVVKIHQEERTYHIFYQIFKGEGGEGENINDFLKKLHLKSTDDYNYIKGGDLLHEGDDAMNFQNTVKCMGVLGFSEEEKDSIFKIISSILQIGNLEFIATQNEGSELKQKSLLYLQYTANLLGVDKEQIKGIMLSKKLIDPEKKKEILTNQTAEQAAYSRDALSKFIYSKLFDFLIEKVTKTLLKPYNKQVDGTISEIGLLDIFGFEIFQENSFEQLCINFANEKLQQHFNQHMFKLEQQEYKNEKIEWDHIKFVDNQATIDLFEKAQPFCIFSALDDECKKRIGSDKTLLEEMSKKISSPQFFMSNSQKYLQSCFGVRHFAGDVVYDVNNFMDKNKDTSNDEFCVVLTGSKNPFVAKLFEQQAQQQQNSGKQPLQPNSTKTQTVSAQFRNQLNDLLQQLHSSHPFYIRCIKPNNDKQPNIINSMEVLRQLRCAGLLEAIRIRKAGYAVRRTHLEFLKSYKMLMPSIQIKTPFIQVCKQFMENLQKIDVFAQKLNPKLKLYQIGEKTVYMKEEIKALLDSQLHIFQKKYIIKIQKVYKGYLIKILYKKMKKIIIKGQRRTRFFLFRKRMQRIIKARKLQANLRVMRVFSKIAVCFKRCMKLAKTNIREKKLKAERELQQKQQQQKIQEQLKLAEIEKQQQLENQTQIIQVAQQYNLVQEQSQSQMQKQVDEQKNETQNKEETEGNMLGDGQDGIFNIQYYLSQIPENDCRLLDLEDKLNQEQQQRQKIEEELNAIRFSRMENSAETQLLALLKAKLKGKFSEERESVFKQTIECNSIEELINNFNDADAEIQKLKLKLDSAEKKNERLKKELESQESSEQAMKQQHDSSVKKYIDENFKLQKELQSLIRKHNDQQTESNKLRSELSIKNEVINKLKERSQLKHIDSQLETKKLKDVQQEFQEELHRREEELNESVQKMTKQDKIIADLQKQTSDLKACNYEMQNKITLNEEEVKALAKQNAELKQELHQQLMKNEASKLHDQGQFQKQDKQLGGNGKNDGGIQNDSYQALQKDFQQLHSYKDHLMKENQASKDICQTLINLLKWKNIEVEHIKKNIVIKKEGDNGQADMYKELSNLKAQEKVLTEKLEKQLLKFQELEQTKEQFNQNQ